MTKMMQWARTTMKKKTNSPAHAPEAEFARGSHTRMAVTAGLLASCALTMLPAATLVVAGTAARAVRAQESTTARRTIRGRVQDGGSAALKGAVVYLKDTRTLAVKSFLSDDEGNFHFGQLASNTDYELYAEFNGKRSKARTISSFDSKNEFNFTLKIDTAQ